MSGKRIGLAVSAGIKQRDYDPSGRYQYTITELTSPLDATIRYIDALPLEPFFFYGAEHHPDDEEIKASALAYVEYIKSLSASPA